MADSLALRKRDLLYLTYFTIAIPISFIVDLQPIYPSHRIPIWMQALTDWYIANYHDQFFITHHHYFHAFIWSEFLVQVPCMVWGWWALYNNSPKVPVVLLPFACLIFITTGVCMVEMLNWPIPVEQKLHLTSLYGPYLALSGFMLVDMVVRLNGLVDRAVLAGTQKKKQ